MGDFSFVLFASYIMELFYNAHMYFLWGDVWGFVVVSFGGGWGLVLLFKIDEFELPESFKQLLQQAMPFSP